MKKSKKFVLAGLALLAITMVLLPLAGCKNDSVPPEVEKQEQGDGGGSETDKNNTAAKLVSITVTPPERTVYSMGQEFDSTGMVVTATYEGGKKREVTGWKTDFNTVAGVKGLNKTVTVNYTEEDTSKSDTFTITVFPKEVKVLTGYTSPNNTDDSWTYVAFGEWPQTIKAEGVDVDETKSKTMGMFTYYLGDDSNYYVKHSDKYYKVEPIVWRVLTTSYKAPEGGTVGEILLLAEKILTGGIKWADSFNNNYKESYIRQWLNGNSGTEETSDYNGDAGFLQTAFTESAQNLIADTTVDNSAASTIPSEITDVDLELGWNSGENQYASDTPTKDKIFLLSEQEATTESYGFATYSDYGKGDTRIRVTTDYAKATGAYQSSTEGYGGWWWLRSPYYDNEGLARVIYHYGDARNSRNVSDLVLSARGGVVPALSISLGGN